MSSFVFMKLLETRASRYDLGMRLLSRGRIQQAYRQVAELVPLAVDVLDVGCGTGGVTGLLLERTDRVTGVDRSPQMLAEAQHKLASAVADGRLRLVQGSITGLERTFGAEVFDCVVCCLVLSELTETEERFALDEFCRILRPGGTLVVADEIAPRAMPRRVAYHLTRAPMAAVTYLLTQTTTQRTRNLGGKLRDRGMDDVDVDVSHGGSFEIVHGRKSACRVMPQV